MRNVTKVLVTVVAIITSALQIPAVQQVVGAFLTAHPSLGALLGGIVSVLALIHQPSEGK